MSHALNLPYFSFCLYVYFITLIIFFARAGEHLSKNSIILTLNKIEIMKSRTKKIRSELKSGSFSIKVNYKFIEA